MNSIYLTIDNSKDAAIKDGKWKNPGAKLYDKLLVAADSRYRHDGRNVFPEPEEAETWNHWQDFLKETYLDVGKDIVNEQRMKTPFSKSGCRYPHHVIKDNKLVVNIPGLYAAYKRACQQHEYSGEIKKHIDRHMKELGLSISKFNESIIESNFDDIYKHLYESMGIDLHGDISRHEYSPYNEVVNMNPYPHSNEMVGYNNLDHIGNQSCIPEYTQEDIMKSLDWIDQFVNNEQFRESVNAENNGIIRYVQLKDLTDGHFVKWLLKHDDWKYDTTPENLDFNTFKNTNENHVYGYYVNDRIEGIVCVVRYDHFYELNMLYVNLDYVGHGIGTKLLSFVTNKYGHNNEMRLDVFQDNARAIHLYEKYGFRQIQGFRIHAEDVGENEKHLIEKCYFTMMRNPNGYDYDPQMIFSIPSAEPKDSECEIWRKENKIELIHKTNTLSDLRKIWVNWQLMTNRKKRKSDEKSMELFGMNNEDHYYKLRNEYPDSNLGESVHNILENYISEKSHSTLKYCYRIGFDINTGEQVAIQFDLDPKQVTGFGDPELTAKAYNKRYHMNVHQADSRIVKSSHEDAKKRMLSKTNRNITKLQHRGHIDFTTDELRIVSIFYKNGKSVDNVGIIPLFSAVFNNFIRRHLSLNKRLNTLYIQSGNKINPVINDPEFKKIFVDYFSTEKQLVETYKVGEYGGKDKYKTGKLMWDMDLFRSLKLTPVVRGTVKDGPFKGNDTTDLTWSKYNITNRPIKVKNESIDTTKGDIELLESFYIEEPDMKWFHNDYDTYDFNQDYIAFERYWFEDVYKQENMVEKIYEPVTHCYRVGFETMTGRAVAIEFDLSPENPVHATVNEHHTDFVTDALLVTRIFYNDGESVDNVSIIPMLNKDVLELTNEVMSNLDMDGYDSIHKVFDSDLFRYKIKCMKPTETYHVGEVDGAGKYKTTRLLWDTEFIMSYKVTPVLKCFNKDSAPELQQENEEFVKNHMFKSLGKFKDNEDKNIYIETCEAFLESLYSIFVTDHFHGESVPALGVPGMWSVSAGYSTDEDGYIKCVLENIQDNEYDPYDYLNELYYSEETKYSYWLSTKFNRVEDLFTWIRKNITVNNSSGWKLQSIETTIASKSGSYIDIMELCREWFKIYEYDYTVYHSNIKSDNKPMLSFVYAYNRNYYWFEPTSVCIIKKYKTLPELIENVIIKQYTDKYGVKRDDIVIHALVGYPEIGCNINEYNSFVNKQPVIDINQLPTTIKECTQMMITEAVEDGELSHPEKVDKAESNKNGVRRKKLYIAFIEWCKEYNNKNTFGSLFDKDIFNVTYPFIPHDMRYFYRLANPLLCVLSGDLTFFQVSELKKLNDGNSKLNEMMIFAATPNDMRVFNCKDGKVYLGVEENGELKLTNALAPSFDDYIQTMIDKGDILNGPLDDDMPPDIQ